ncbi:MAG: hypothetical protein LBQ39_04565 [Tannerellaceae bacterium]|jgi:hypothetical protein|nr:hypothetical protein [Tannerellaceae bacterium]
MSQAGKRLVQLGIEVDPTAQLTASRLIFRPGAKLREAALQAKCEPYTVKETPAAPECVWLYRKWR